RKITILFFLKLALFIYNVILFSHSPISILVLKFHKDFQKQKKGFINEEIEFELDIESPFHKKDAPNTHQNQAVSIDQQPYNSQQQHEKLLSPCFFFNSTTHSEILQLCCNQHYDSEMCSHVDLKLGKNLMKSISFPKPPNSVYIDEIKHHMKFEFFLQIPVDNNKPMFIFKC
ncbi:hypothetical protein LINPERHAP2_LOCUS37236, partial [Linum perenne]